MKPYIVPERNMFFSKQILTPTAAHVNYNIQIKVKKKRSTLHKHYKKPDIFQKKLQIASTVYKSPKI